MSNAVSDLTDLLKGIPAGAWVAISEREHKVLAFGADAPTVYSEARDLGETSPLIVRVPDQTSAMFF